MTPQEYNNRLFKNMKQRAEKAERQRDEAVSALRGILPYSAHLRCWGDKITFDAATIDARRILAEADKRGGK